MKNSLLQCWFLCCFFAFAVPLSVAAQCGAGEAFFTHDLTPGQVNEVAFEVCPTAGMAAEARIIAGNLFAIAPNNLQVYQGASGSGVSGTLVFGPANGDLAGNTISGTLADDCLLFVFNSLAGATVPNSQVQVCGSSIPATSSVSLVLSGDAFCSDDAVQTLSGGMPSGGVYSGTGVTDNGNGTDFQFDPATAGAGTTTITYTESGNMATDDIVVTGANSVTMDVTLTSRCVDEGSLVLPGGGMPQGGVYSGPGVTDLGDGVTFRFNPATAGLGTATITYTGPAPCFDQVTDQITVVDACTCPEGQDSYFFCQGNSQTNVVAFEVCPSAGFAAQATITAGTYGVFVPDGDVLNVYTGASGSGTAGMVVAANLSGDLSGTVIEGSVADDCLIFVSSTGPVGSCQDGLETGLAVCGEDIAPSVSFMDPGDFCVSGGVVTGLTGGLPVGGVYSGPGVTDDGNGTTFSFDPAAAGVGTQTLTYTNIAAASVMVEVFNTGVVSFTAPADVCIDAGVQTDLGGGSPAGGTYSGPGVTDNGDGTYDFNPALAGLGIQTISYTDATGCMETATDEIEVLAACGCPSGETSLFACAGNNETDLVLFEMCPTAGMAAEVTIGQGTFGMDDELTIYQGASGSGTGGTVLESGLRGDLAGEVYTANGADDCLIFVLTSGPVTSCQDGFELPLEACGRSVLSVSFVALDDISVNAGVQTGLSGGLPTGGVYSGPGVTDDGNGMTYTFDPAAAGVGVQTLAYTFMALMATDDVEVLNLTPPTFAKSFSPATIAPGSVTTLTFEIDNTGSEPATDIAFVDNLPAGMTVAFPAVVTSTCPSGTVTAVEGSSSISFTDGTLGGTTNCEISVNVTSSTVGLSFNVTGDLTSSSGNSGTASAELTVDGDAPGFSKSFSPPTVNIGEVSTLTFTIDNTAGSVDLNGVQFTDNLPTGMLVAPSANVSTSCTGGVVTADPGANTITYQGGFTTTVAAGTSCAISVDVISSASGRLENVTENLSARNNLFQQLNSGYASAALTVRQPGDLLIQKRFVDNPVRPGETTALEFTITNFDRNFSATNVSFTDNLAATLAGLTATGTPVSDVCGLGAQLSGTTMLTFTGGTIAPESSCTFSVPLQVPAGTAPGSYPSTSSQVTADFDGTPVAGNMAAASLTVSSVPLFTKTFLSDPVVAGGTVEMEVSITNTSASSDFIDISFADDVSAFISGALVSALPANGSCGPGSSFFLTGSGDERSLEMTGGNLPASGNCTFTVELQIPEGNAPGTYTNTTSFLTGTIDGQTVNASPAQDDLTVLAVPTLTKSFTNDPVNPGDIVDLEFTLTYDEFATGDATDISFTDDLNAVIPGLAVVSGPAADVCGTGSSISGTTELTFTAGTLSPGGSCTFTVAVQVPTDVLPGSYTNTTSELTATVGGLPATGNAATDDLEVGGLAFTKEFIDDPVLPGGLTTLRFTIENTSAFDATDIVFTDNLSSVLPGLVTEGALPVMPCGGDLVASGNSFLIFSGGAVSAGNTCTFDVQLRVPAATSADTYNNVTSNLTATIDGATRVLAPATDQLTVDDTRIQLTKVFTNDPVLPGGTVTLEYTLTNLDPANTITDIAFTDDLGAALAGLAGIGLPVNDICNVGSQLSGTNVLSFTGGTLAPGASCTFSVDLQVPAGTTPGTMATSTSSSVTGTLNSTAVEGDPGTDDLQIAGLTFTKAFMGTPLPGGTATLTFTITNEDPVNPVLDITFTDDLDAVIPGLVATALPVDDLCNTGSLLSGSSVITYDRGELAPGQSCSFDVTVSVPCDAAPGTYPNTTSSLTALSNSTLLMVNPATADLTVSGPVVSFTGPADLCIDATPLSNLGGGMPAGGVYSGPGVTDNNDGMTYDFDPAMAGIGVHEITYSITNGNGCVISDSDMVEVFALPTVTFIALADLCEDAGVQNGLGGGTPTGGTYSGPGVTDDGNGMTYSFDPAVAGVGVHLITYIYMDPNSNGCSNFAADEVEVFALPTVSFTADPIDVCIEDDVVAGLGGGLPTGGVYSGTGVTDDGNGMTFSFNPMATPAGGNVTITYTFTDVNGCSGSATDVYFVDPVCNEPPVAVCTTVTVDADANCQAMVAAIEFDGGSLDPDMDELTFSVSPAGPYSLGTTAVELTVSDGEFSSTCTTSVTVEDNTDPVLMCNETISIELPEMVPAAGFEVPQAEINALAVISESDNCAANPNGPFSVGGPSARTFDCSQVGEEVTITLTINDGNGNSDECIVNVDVQDNVDPTIVLGVADTTLYLDANGMVSLTIDDNADWAEDNCGILDVQIDRVPGADAGPESAASSNARPRTLDFTCDDVGNLNLEVEIEATDVNGNITLDTITVTVLDTVPPMAICQDIEVFLDENGNATAFPDDVDNNSTDACGIDFVIFTSDPADEANQFDELPFTCDNTGANPVVLLVFDNNGNSSSCAATVTVTDSIAPVVTTADQMGTLDDLTGTFEVDPNDVITEVIENCEVVSVDFSRSLIFDCEDIGENEVTVTVTDASGRIGTSTFTVTIEFNQPNLACRGDINITLNDDCQALLIPSMVLSGNVACLDVFDFDIVVQDSDPSNGPIIDGCGEFTYVISQRSMVQQPATLGFTGFLAGENWTVDNFLSNPATQTATVNFTASTLTLRTSTTDAFPADPGSVFVAQTFFQFGEAGTVELDYNFNGVDAPFDVFLVATDFEGGTVDGIFDFEQASGSLTLDIQPGYSLFCSITDDGFQPGPDNNVNELTISNFSFTPAPPTPDILDLDFETCWGTVRAEDKTSPIVVEQVAPIDLLCVDVDDNRVALLDNSVSRCFLVDGATGLAPASFNNTTLGRTLWAGTGAPVYPIFTDGCAQQLEVCVTESFDTDAEDPMCNDMVLTRTFTATEVSSCVSAAGEENAPAVASYVITFTRPGLDDLNGDNIPAVSRFTECGETSGSIDDIRATYPAPRANDYPFLSLDGRTFPLSLDQTVCNIGVTYADGNPTITCPNTYKFVRTYTVIDWCNPNEVATFSQIVKVGDNAAPDFTGPTQDRNLDGIADEDLIYTTNSGSLCAAFLVLDGPGVGVSDNCSDARDVVISATIFPFGDLTANPIGAFNVDLFNGTPEVSTPIPPGTHLLVYTYSDECGNEGSTPFEFTVEDRTAPVAVCEDGLNISISSGGTTGGASTGVAVLTPDMIDAGSADDCSDVTLTIARVDGDNVATEVYDDQLILTCADLGTVRVGLRVEDEAGNVNFCWLDVLVEDKSIPVCIPPGPMNITCVEYNENFPADITEVSDEELAAIFGSAVGIDNCAVTVTSEVSGELNNCGIGSITRTFVATDEVGFTNSGTCQQIITIRGVHDYRITFPTDDAGECADIPAFAGLETDEYACDLITTNVTVDTIEAVNAPDVCFTLRVSYDVINFCEYNQLGECYRIPRDGDGIRDPESQLLYLNVIPESDVNTGDDIAFLSRFTDRNFNPTAPQNDQLVDDGDDTDGSDDDNDNDNIDEDAYAQDDSRGFFCYVQFVDVYDSDAPSIVVDTPEECFAGTSETCTAEVVLTFTAEDDCIAPEVSLELDANYNPGDLDFTGFTPDNAAALGIGVALSNDGPNYTITATNVPVGNHAIRVRANDGCGNTDLDIIEFCVEGDKAPTPICIETLTVTLMPDGAGGGMAAIWASDFIASDVEDCFGNVIENYSIYREAGFDESQVAVGDLGLNFDCDDFEAGTVPVRVYAIADNGTADYCSVIVEVQAFQDGLCDGVGGNLAGTIETQHEEPIVGVEVSLSGADEVNEMVVTDNNGAFTFLNLAFGADYTVQPAHLLAVDLATVTVTDVVMIGNVILGVESFDSNYDYLAGDVDQDQYLSVGDMVAIQRVILGLDDMYATGESWGFVPADVDVSDPFAEVFPGVYNINDLATNVFDADFVGFAYGDVNSVGRSSAALEVEDARLEAGQAHSVVISGAELAGFQGTLELAAGLELVDVAFEGEGGLNLSGAAEGVIAMMFRSAATVTVEVRATEAGLLSDMISLTSNRTLAEGVNANGTSGELNLAFSTSDAPASAQNALLQNVPNPAVSETMVRFTLAEAGPATLTLRDVAGRMLREIKIDAVMGLNRIELNGLTVPGVISYTLVAGDFSATKKMVIVR